MTNLNLTMEKMKEYYEEFGKMLQKLGKDCPKFVHTFKEFFEATEGKGVLDRKTKELISVALSVKAQCPFCIAFHVKNALAAGAKPEEIVEAGLVAVLMGGGPSLAYMTYVYKAIEEFTAPEEQK
jgi:AhpD family alkylhydroperoxidase